MKVLLVKPIDYRPTKFLVPPIGLGYLATALISHNHDVSILDCVRLEYDFSKFRKFIEKEHPEAVGFQVFSRDLFSVKKSIEIIKNIDPSIITIVGGAHPSGDPTHTMNFLDKVDFGIKGEGEVALQMLLDNLEERKNLNNIPGLIWKKNKIIKINQPIYVRNLDSLGFPSWGMIDPRLYSEAGHSISYRNLPLAPVITSRGCPFRCTFCATHCITGRKIRYHTIKYIIKQIDLLHNKFGVNEIQIEDDNFTFDRNFVMKFCEKLIKKDYKIDWCLPNGVRLDTLDKELLIMMKKSGCYAINAGIESGSEKILKMMKKNINLKTIKNKISLIKNLGLETRGFFIMGFPNETLNDIKKSIDLAFNLDLDRVQFSLYMPIPGSESYQKLIKNKEISPNNLDWENFSVTNVTYHPKKISEKTLKDLHRYTLLKYHLRPLKFIKFLKGIRSLNHSKFVIRRVLEYLHY